MNKLQGKLIVTGGVCLALFATVAHAGSVLKTITDGNSVAQFELGDTGNPDDRGQVLWTVDGIEQIFQQWFWFRVGNSQERSIEDGPDDGDLGPMRLDFTGTRDSNNDGDIDTLFARYEVDTNVTNAPPPFSVEILFRMDGGALGSGVSDIQEQIRIINTNAFGTPDLDLHFFQYVDFDLAGTPLDDTVALLSSNTVLQTDGQGLMTAAETVVSPRATLHELGVIGDPSVTATRDKLDDGDADNLDPTVLLRTDVNATWAFQWDLRIPAGGTALISKDKAITFIIPVPIAIWPGLAALGMLGAGSWYRRRQSSGF